MRVMFILSLLIMFGFETVILLVKDNTAAKIVLVVLIAFVCLTLTIMGVKLW